MNVAIVKTIFLKELRDTLRDKRTLIAMIGLPIVLYPGLFLTATQVGIVVQNRIAETPSRVAVSGPGDTVREWLQGIPRIDLADSEDPAADLRSREVDAVIFVEDGLVDAERPLTLRIDYDGTEVKSREALGRLERGLAAVEARLLTERLAERGLPETFAKPLDIARENVAPAEKRTGYILGSIVPLIMVVMIGVGAFYPAVDLTAGEKERGTFETLLSTPVSKLEIVTGKFLAVFSLAMTTGLLNLGSMVATLMFQLNQVIRQTGGASSTFELSVLQVPPGGVVIIAIVLIPMAFFISAVMMTIALFAKSFKDAQNFVTPFFIAIITPAAVGAIPGVELNNVTQFVPIANVALLFRDLLTGVATAETIFIVFFCTSVYAALALVAATWVFQRDEVILSEEKGIPLTLRRTEFLPREAPTPGMVLGLFGLVMLLIFYVGTYLQAERIYLGLAITLYLLILAPTVGLLWFVRVDLRSGLNLFRPPWQTLLGTLVIMPGWIVIIIQVAIWQNRILPLPPGYVEFFEQILRGGGDYGLGFMILLLALSPAICEEALFRGAMVSGLRQRMPQWAVILLIGLAFGLFHLSVYRVLPTGLSGILLTYLAVRSRSIWPAVLAHFLLNGLNIGLESDYSPDAIRNLLQRAAEDGEFLPWWMVMTAAGAVIVGLMIVEIGARRTTSETQP